MEKVATINDVARLAGVSKGTVDRVVHNRGEVSERSAVRVRQAIEELNYQPNLHAALLATKSERRIVCMIPKDGKGTYWGNVRDSLMAQKDSAEALSLRLEMHYYDMNDLDSFLKAGNAVIERNPDGVILAPLFMNEAKELAGRFHRKRIPYLYIDTKIEDINCLSYIGMPKFRSGYLCAALLTLNIKKEEHCKIAIIRVQRDKAGLSDPTVNRREGFLSYVSDYYPHVEIINVMIDPSGSSEQITRTLEQALSGTGIRHIAMLSSRIHLISDFLSKHNDKGLTIIGFDALEDNLKMLKDNLVEAIITEKVETMSEKAFRMMADYLVLYKSPESRDNYMHMDILTCLNMDNY